MTKYISNPDNLKLMMNMLKEKSRNIQFEAFHVFKVNLLTYFFFSKFKNVVVVVNVLDHKYFFFKIKHLFLV